VVLDVKGSFLGWKYKEELVFHEFKCAPGYENLSLHFRI